MKMEERVSWTWTIALSLAVLVPPATASAQAGHRYEPPPGWPACEDRQVEVVLLGTFHMAGHAEEIRSPRRQAEIRTLVDGLVEMEPTGVALEADIGRQEQLQAAYRAHVEEGRELTANERQQIGFRLARRLNHDSVHAVDYPLHDIGNDSIGAFYDRHPELQRRYAWVLEGVERWRAESDRRREEATIEEYLRWMNGESALARESNNIMYGHVMAGEGSNYGGPRMLEKWYSRNLRTVHHLSRLADHDDRILLVIGGGHVRVLRDLLELAPQYCPVSPLPWLPADGASS